MDWRSLRQDFRKSLTLFAGNPSIYLYLYHYIKKKIPQGPTFHAQRQRILSATLGR